jgi:hypothetical protein
MTSFQQFEANRRNALRSTGPRTENGKRQSRVNAMRHGLTAETVIGSLEDAEDYKAFEATIISDYCAETAVARELVLRLASLLWRLRRATAIETDLLQIQAEAVEQHRDGLRHSRAFKIPERCSTSACGESPVTHLQTNGDDHNAVGTIGTTRALTHSFLRLANLDSGVFERLNRYEAALWRQTVQAIIVLRPLKQRWKMDHPAPY